MGIGPKVPFPTNLQNQPDYGHGIRGMPKDYYGGIQTDKLGELGIGYVQFYELTGEQKYLNAAICCADALAAHIRPGDENHTPWPFRLDAHSGKVINGEEYGGMIIAPVPAFRRADSHPQRPGREVHASAKGGVGMDHAIPDAQRPLERIF